MSTEGLHDPLITLFIRAGRDGCSVGACPDSQRVLSLLHMKLMQPKYKSELKVQIIPVCISRPPESFTNLGLRLRVPAIYLKSRNLIEDTTDEIIQLLEKEYPGGILYSTDEKLEAAAEIATRYVN